MRSSVVRAHVVIFVAWVSALLASVASAGAVKPPPSEYEQPGRVVVVSDILGEFNLFADLLRNADLIDDDNHWIGGEAQLVILGNLVGLGQGVRPLFDLVRSLQRQAQAAGGMVHMLLGYGEIQLLHRDVGVVNPRNYADLATDDSAEKIKQMIERGVQEVLARFPDAPYPDRLRREYEHLAGESFKPGAVEFLATVAPGAELGDWLRSRNVVIRIGDNIYSHGGLNIDYAKKSLDEINNAERASLAHETLLLQKDIDIAHPAWWRELGARSEVQMQPVVDTVAYMTKARAQIVGVNRNALPTRQGLHARVFFVDSGMRSYQLHAIERKFSALEIKGDEYTLLWNKDRFLATPPPPVPEEPALKIDTGK